MDTRNVLIEVTQSEVDICGLKFVYSLIPSYTKSGLINEMG